MKCSNQIQYDTVQYPMFPAQSKPGRRWKECSKGVFPTNPVLQLRPRIHSAVKRIAAYVLPTRLIGNNMNGNKWQQENNSSILFLNQPFSTLELESPSAYFVSFYQICIILHRHMYRSTCAMKYDSMSNLT